MKVALSKADLSDLTILLETAHGEQRRLTALLRDCLGKEREDLIIEKIQRIARAINSITQLSRPGG